jgi:DNA-binding response OmpR family regulator
MAKILLVDDDPDVIEAGRIILEREGHQVWSASNREQGMQAVRTHQPDLLILDVMMEQPDDGITLAQDLRREGVTIPILMLTSIGKVTGQRFERDEALPVDSFYEKPIKPAELIAQVKALLAGKKGA